MYVYSIHNATHIYMYVYNINKHRFNRQFDFKMTPKSTLYLSNMYKKWNVTSKNNVLNLTIRLIMQLLTKKIVTHINQLLHISP